MLAWLARERQSILTLEPCLHTLMQTVLSANQSARTILVIWWNNLFISRSATRRLFSVVIGRYCSRESLQTSVQPPQLIYVAWLLSRLFYRDSFYREISIPITNVVSPFLLHDFSIEQKENRNFRQSRLVYILQFNCFIVIGVEWDCHITISQCSQWAIAIVWTFSRLLYHDLFSSLPYVSLDRESCSNTISGALWAKRDERGISRESLVSHFAGNPAFASLGTQAPVMQATGRNVLSH